MCERLLALPCMLLCGYMFASLAGGLRVFGCCWVAFILHHSCWALRSSRTLSSSFFVLLGLYHLLVGLQQSKGIADRKAAAAAQKKAGSPQKKTKMKAKAKKTQQKDEDLSRSVVKIQLRAANVGTKVGAYVPLLALSL